MSHQPPQYASGPDARPPQWADQLLKWFCPPHLLEEVQGDLHEVFQRQVEEVGLATARFHYLEHVLAYCHPFFLKRKPIPSPTPPFTAMFHSYLTVALRNLRKDRVYATINIFGLAIGLTCCLLIFLYVRGELSYDQYHSKAHRICRVVSDIINDAQTNVNAQCSGPVGPHLKADFPEVEQAVRTVYLSFVLQYQEKKFQEDQIIATDAGLFAVFDFPLKVGNPKTALVAPFSVVLTERGAAKYFGNEDPMGKPLRLNGKYTATVTGVAGGVPENSQFTSDILLSMTTLHEIYGKEWEYDWGNYGWYTYVLLPENYDPKKLQAKLPAFIHKYTGPTSSYNQKIKTMGGSPSKYKLFLEPLTEVYLRSDRDSPRKGNLTNVYLFSVIAGFILLIACFNYTNLSVAKAAERAKEVGVRKVIGASRPQLTLQFLSESLLFSLLAFGIALLASQLLLPVFNELAAKTISEGIISRPLYWLVLLLLSLVVGVLAGLYPAVVLSKFKPILVLKGRFSSSKHGLSLRKVLVVLQFTVSVSLIAATLVVYHQLDYLRSKPMGFAKQQMLIARLGKMDLTRTPQQVERLKTELAKIPGMRSATASGGVPGNDILGWRTIELQNKSGQMQAAIIGVYSVDYDFLNHYQIPLLAGRAFSEKFATDSTQAMLVNETLARQLGYPTPEEILGKPFTRWGGKGQVVGVVKDFHIASLQREIPPACFWIDPKDFWLISLKVDSQNLPATIARLQSRWQQLEPQRPFDYFFLDESIGQQYRTEERFGALFLYFASLAIFVACLGLLGLISFTTQQRAKEIGIRKVLGATVNSIVVLLSKDLLWLVLLAFGIALPLAWYLMRKWLENFAYHVNLSWWVFALAGILTLVIAMLTLSFQSIKAARANPVKSLRSE